MQRVALKLILLGICGVVLLCETVDARNNLPPSKNTPVVITTINSCPVPSAEMLKCLREWACQYIIRLDLRCLLNLNGNPLLDGVLGGTGLTSAVNGATGGVTGGLLQNILGG